MHDSINSWAAAQTLNCQLAAASVDAGGALFLEFGRLAGSIRLSGTAGRPTGQDWQRARFLVVDLENPQPCNESLHLDFWEQGDPDGKPHITFSIRLFPNLRARVVLELSRLDSQLFFLPLKPGTLKSEIIGNSADRAMIDRFALGLNAGFQDARRLIVHEIYLTDCEPDYPPADRVTADEFGQWTAKEWPGKVADLGILRQNLDAAWQESLQAAYPEDWDIYGGCRRLHLAGEGYFRVRKDHGRWWLIDPLGNAFFSMGVFGVYPGEPGWIHGNEGYHAWLPPRDGEFAAAWSDAEDSELYRRKFHGLFPPGTGLYSFATTNLIRSFGPEWRQKWTELTAGRLFNWGINTLSMFSDPQFIADSGRPFMIMLHGFPTTDVKIFREFPDVYAPEYAANCRIFSRQLSPYAVNRNLIGYFLNNEPTWGFIPDLILAEKLLEDDRQTASRAALISFLADRYDGDIDRFNAAWNLEMTAFEDLRTPLHRASRRSAPALADLQYFSQEMILRYARLPSEETRLTAPHHLNLGMRFARVNSAALLATHRYFDVFSFNCYSLNPGEAIDKIASQIDMPLLIGEFHFGALDRGLPSPSLVAVPSQEDRGKAYARYLDQVATRPCSVGAHYFAWNDQPLWGRYDGENYQFGLVDICNQAYPEFTKSVARTNRTIYDLLSRHRKPFEG